MHRYFVFLVYFLPLIVFEVKSEKVVVKRKYGGNARKEKAGELSGRSFLLFQQSNSKKPSWG